MFRNEDIRWHSLKENRRCTYIESLKAEVTNHFSNRHMAPAEWGKIEELLPTITEDDAKELCFKIRESSRASANLYSQRFG